MKTFSSLLSLTALSILISGCAAAITQAEIQQKSAQGFRLISLAEGVQPVWKSAEEVSELIGDDTGFFDVTEFYDPSHPDELVNSKRIVPANYDAPSRTDEVNALFDSISLTNMQQYNANLTSYFNRHYQSPTGVAASVWIRDTVQDFINAYPESGASVSLFDHTYPQSTIIAIIPGTSLEEPILVLGGHMDSTNRADRTAAAPSPGADDDGSGTGNLLEIFRVLLSNGFKPTRTIEFHWYAAEEAGRLGSQAVALKYKENGAQVKAMLQLDMTAYTKPGLEEVVGLIPDFVDPNLTEFVGSLVDEYLDIPWIYSNPCGYACSDHASWNREGFPSAFPFESALKDSNPFIHTVNDTVDLEGFSWSHSVEFTKLGIAFAVELGA